MAPTKGFLIQRLMAPDFMGIQWNKITHHAPMHLGYPWSIYSGLQWRIFSHPRFQGNKANRHGRNSTRAIAFMAPTAVMAVLFIGMVDWYNCFQLVNTLFGVEIPKWAVDARAAELEDMARNKPGVLLKHKSGGQVSIPGSGVLVTGDE